MKQPMRALLVAVLVLTAIDVRAQWSADADASWMSDDNVENNAFRLADRILGSSMRLSYGHENSTYDLLFSAGISANLYSVVSDRTFIVPDLQVTLGTTLDDAEIVRGELSLQWLSRNGRNDYAFLDYSHLGFTTSLLYDPSDATSFAGIYQFRSLSFSELASFDYLEHMFNASGSWSFESRTTFIVRAGVGTKIYAASSIDSSAYTSGRGQHSGSSAGAIQTWGSLRIGQGITDNTGISLTLQGQANLRSNPISLAGSDLIISDQEIFDDRYGYEGWTISALLTQVIWEGTRARLGYTEQQKSYVALPAYDLDGVQIADRRNDRRTTLLLSLDQELSFGTLQAVYEHITNASNDLFFNYPNSAFTLQISLPFGR